MKKALYYISILCVLIITGCTDRDILDSKPGEAIDPVSNLQYTINGTNVILTWSLPSKIPVDIIQPVSIYLQVKRNNVAILSVVLPNAPSSYTYTGYDASKSYIFIVKIQGSVDTKDPNVSNLRYSLGQSVSF